MYESELKSIYYGKKRPGAFLSLNGLYHVAKKQIPNLRYSDVEKFLNKQTVYLQRKEEPKNRQIKGSKRYFHVYRPEQELVIDTAYLKRYKTPFKFLLLGVDAFTKRLYIGFMRKLSGAGTARIVEKWLTNKKYKVVLTDQGDTFCTYSNKH